MSHRDPNDAPPPPPVETESSVSTQGGKIIVLGVNHNTAPVALRERFAFRKGSITEIARDLIDTCGLAECSILSTCNRTEIYGVGQEPLPGEVLRFVAERQGVNPLELREHSYELRDAEAVRHLCRVASGLDSMVLGEHQILGQVKDVSEEAMAGKTSGTILNALFRQAITAGKRARSETTISRGAVSISHAAVDLARTIFGELSGCRALVLGAGEMSEITLKLLRAAGMKTSIMISSRTRERAEALAQQCQGIGVEWEQFPNALAEADIVIVSTSAPHIIVKAETVRQAMRARRGRHIFMFDISVPRNVDPTAGELDDVFLYNIDDLQGIVQKNLGDRSLEVARVDQIIQEEVDRFLQWKNSLGVVPAIVGMRTFAETVRQEEWERFQARLAHLSERDLRTVEALTRQLVNKLIHPALTQLKTLGVNGKGYDRVEVLRDLFGFTDDQENGVESGMQDAGTSHSHNQWPNSPASNTPIGSPQSTNRNPSTGEDQP